MMVFCHRMICRLYLRFAIDECGCDAVGSLHILMVRNVRPATSRVVPILRPAHRHNHPYYDTSKHLPVLLCSGKNISTPAGAMNNSPASANFITVQGVGWRGQRLLWQLSLNFVLIDYHLVDKYINIHVENTRGNRAEQVICYGRTEGK